MFPFRGQLLGKPLPATIYISVVPKPKHNRGREIRVQHLSATSSTWARTDVGVAIPSDFAGYSPECFADFFVALAIKTICRSKAANVRRSLNIPDENVCHGMRFSYLGQYKASL